MVEKLQELQLNSTKIESEIESAKKLKEEVLKSIEVLQNQQKENVDKLYKAQIAAMQEKLDGSAEKLGKKYQDYEQECIKNYTLLLEETSKEFSTAMELKRQELTEIEETIATLRAKSDAAVEALKREEDKKLQLDKYKISLSEIDLLEINRLREIAPYFRNARPIYKAIWESYYRTPLTELIHRVIGTGTKTGIYKLTNLKNGFCYIGQAANLSDRWSDHCKAGLGIDTPNSKLYVAMKEDGVENFTFEVLELCGRAELNDREKYWIDFYRSQEVGYNMRQGGARK